MPALSPIPIIAYGVIISKQLKTPVNKKKKDWKPKGVQGAMQYGQALYESNNLVGMVPVPFPLVMPQMGVSRVAINKLHSDAAKELTKIFKDFTDDMLNAVKFAHTMWKMQAKFKDLKVMALSAIGTPGCLDGPKLESLIKNAPSAAKHATGNAKKWRDAVAKGVSEQFDKYQGKVTIPGLPFYPAFVAFPGPQAPPMPNVPFPLIACVSPMIAEITVPKKLTDAMVKALDSGLKDDDDDKYHEAVFEGIATSLCLAFLIWVASQQVMLVLGKGPIPTFAPPYVPVGPVVAGDNIAIPGHLMT